MVQQHLTLWNVPKQHHVCPNFNGKVLNFLSTAAQQKYTARDGDPGAGLTLHHHSLDSYMEDMKWFSSISPCGMSPNSM
jgi:hypothetical protein